MRCLTHPSGPPWLAHIAGLVLAADPPSRVRLRPVSAAPNTEAFVNPRLHRTPAPRLPLPLLVAVAGPVVNTLASAPAVDSPELSANAPDRAPVSSRSNPRPRSRSGRCRGFSYAPGALPSSLLALSRAGTHDAARHMAHARVVASIRVHHYGLRGKDRARIHLNIYVPSRSATSWFFHVPRANRAAPVLDRGHRLAYSHHTETLDRYHRRIVYS
ncbi:hypothetical protein MSAN_01351900 [Mycena sanguinolenta]|uniref:Uncharacterized protein n=1 Tax=Mycena sanguinolenta TaxID=230812 RepID=A0A8H6YF50_9AGAR|nr:hypothetical protein MSAN_01351900 [Mycena sanguinolenta]